MMNRIYGNRWTEMCTVMHLGTSPPISPSVYYIAIILIVKWKVFAINYKNDENSVLKIVDVMCAVENL